MSYHEKCERLRELVRQLKEDRHPKTVKALLLSEVRELERELQFDLGNYNSPDFAASIR